MKLHNTLSRTVEEFKSLENGQVKLYTCGPTVYDHVHIGNFRSYIFDDLLRRTLSANGYDLVHVMNITDVDDKTIKRSRTEYPQDNPKAALDRLTRRYEEIFLQDAEKLGIDFSQTKFARATEHINEMKTLIGQIPYKYISVDGIYFEVGQDSGYGRLVKLDRSHEHHRIDNDEYDKEHVADFALWKRASDDEPSWDFDIEGKQITGRPGWHIECSAMSVKYLGQPFDIHTGGIDLKFPHHENEIAQSNAAAGKGLANYFVHGEHLLIDGRRMGKSLKNFYSVEDLEKKAFDPLAFRLLALQSHYRSQSNFTWESLAAAQQRLQRYRAYADLRFQPQAAAEIAATDFYKQNQSAILNELSNDLATPEALVHLDNLIDDMAALGGAVHPDNIESFNEFLHFLDQVLGLKLLTSSDITEQQKQTIKHRQAARQQQNWPQSDKIRQSLQNEGIEIDDTPAGSIWRRR